MKKMLTYDLNKTFVNVYLESSLCSYSSQSRVVGGHLTHVWVGLPLGV